ncbi:MAG: hypothetical protein P4L87_24225 [Formivibrio sp.]|nr:hypothetical protein [Formivibrio sp.]
MSTKRIKIISSQRTTGKPSNFRIDLVDALTEGPYKLAEAYICNSAYNVPAATTFTWRETFGTNAYDRSSTLAAGCYTASAIASAVAAAMTAGDVGSSALTWTGTYSSITGLISFTNSDPTNWTAKFLPVFASNVLSPLIGFNGSEPILSAGGSSRANVNANLSFNIHINYGASVSDAKSAVSTYVVPISSNFNEFVLYQAANENRQIAHIVRAKSLNVSIVNDAGVEIAIGTDWYMILERCG